MEVPRAMDVVVDVTVERARADGMQALASLRSTMPAHGCCPTCTLHNTEAVRERMAATHCVD